MKIVRWPEDEGYVVGWKFRRKKFLIDALTARAIRKNKEKEDELRFCDRCGAICDSRVGVCECTTDCPYPPRL